MRSSMRSCSSSQGRTGSGPGAGATQLLLQPPTLPPPQRRLSPVAHQHCQQQVLSSPPWQQQGPARPLAAAPRAATSSASFGGSPAGGGGSAKPGLSVLQSTRPVDRLRYQAKLLFDQLDTEGKGVLSVEQLGAYTQSYCEDRFGKNFNSKLDTLYSPLILRATDVQFEEFVDLVREQVNILSKSNFIESQYKGADIGKMLYQFAVPQAELTKALVVFKLLDFNNDGFIRADEYSKVQGIEKKVWDSVLVDADENDDGFLTFNDFMASYQRERPVLLSMAVMLAHTAAFYLIFNCPLDTVFKALMGLVLVLKPAIITNPVIKLWHIATALINSGRAQQALSSAGES